MTVHTVSAEPEGRPLRFLSHGDPVHDGLIDKTVQYARSSLDGARGAGETIRFDPDNTAAARFRGKSVVASAALADPSTIGLPHATFSRLEEDALEIIRSALGEAQKVRLQSLLDQAVEWWNADRRWLGFQMEPVFETIALFLDDDSWKVMPASALADLLKADSDKKDARFPKAYGQPFRIDSDLFDEAVDDLHNSLRARAKALWREKLLPLQDALSRRLSEWEVERNDLLSVLQMNVERAWTRADVEDERQRQMLSGQAEAAERIFKLAELASAARVRWLRDAPAMFESPEPGCLGTILFRPVPYQDF